MTFPNPYTICNNKGHTKSNEKRILFELTTDSNFPQFKNINPREDTFWIEQTSKDTSLLTLCEQLVF